MWLTEEKSCQRPAEGPFSSHTQPNCPIPQTFWLWEFPDTQLRPKLSIFKVWWFSSWVSGYTQCKQEITDHKPLHLNTKSGSKCLGWRECPILILHTGSTSILKQKCSVPDHNNVGFYLHNQKEERFAHWHLYQTYRLGEGSKMVITHSWTWTWGDKKGSSSTNINKKNHQGGTRQILKPSSRSNN